MTKITALAALASPQQDDVLPVVDVHDTTMAASGTTKKITVAALTSGQAGLAPSGDTSGATDKANIQGLLNITGRTRLQAGAFYINAALSMVTGTALAGAGSGATTITQTSTTANGITIAGTTVANVTVTGLRLNGPNTGSGVGITAAANGGANPVVQLALDDLIIYQFGSHGVALNNTIVSVLKNIQSVNNLARGFWLNEGTSTTLISCYANTNASERGYYIQSLLYSALVGCAADGNAIGYEMNGCDSVTLTSCGAEVTLAAGGLDGSSFKVSGGSVNVGIRNCRALTNRAIGAYFTGNSTECTLDGFTETAGAGATASIQVDSGSQVTASNYDAATAQSFASGSTTILNSGGYTFLRTPEFGAVAVFDSGTDTSNTAVASAPSFTSGVAAQLSTAQDTILYIAVQTSAALAVAIGPANTTTTTICPSKSYALSLLTIRVPRSWWVKLTGTMADLSITAVTC